MKKINILIAVFAVLAGVSSARAGEVIDFDGKTSKAVSFAEALGSVEAVQTGAIKIEKVVSDELPGRPAPEFNEKQVKEMDKSIGTAIAYVREQKLPDAFTDSFTCLLQKGTPEQKAEFVYQTKGGEYTFPAVCKNQNKGICTWVTQKVCETVLDPKTGFEQFICTMVPVWACPFG